MRKNIEEEFKTALELYKINIESNAMIEVLEDIEEGLYYEENNTIKYNKRRRI